MKNTCDTINSCLILILGLLSIDLYNPALPEHGRHIVWTNQAFSQLCGYSPEELFGKLPDMLNSGMQSKLFYADLWQTILSGNVWRGIIKGKQYFTRRA